MRHIGNLPDETQARRFEDYLLTREIKAKTEPEEDGWAVWIYDEDHVEPAKEELAAFRENPDARDYVVAIGKAHERRREELKEVKQFQKRQVDIRRKWQRPTLAQAPVTVMLTLISVFVALITTDFDQGGMWGLCNDFDSVLKHLFFRPVVVRNGAEVWGDVLPALRRGEVHHLVTPIFIHFDILHILFNMLWLRQLGTMIEIRRGWWRMLLIVLFIAVTSNTAQHLYNLSVDRNAPFGGMSGVVFGLFGYIWMKSKYDPGSGFFMPSQIVFLMIAWLFICFTGAVGPIANAAHLVGLLAGAVLALGPTLLRDARRR